jgi:hypothetical protein
MTEARYYRGPDEPGGDGEVLMEIVDGKSRRSIEHSVESADCIGYDEWPVKFDFDEVPDYMWEIGREEFESEWKRYCGSL